MTRVALAKALGVACRSVDGWRENGCPRHPDGSYDLEQVQAWRAEREAKRRPVKPEGDELGENWMERDLRAVALTREKKLADLYDSYFHRDHVQKLLDERADALRRGFLRLPSALQLAFPEVKGLEEKLLEYVTELLDAYAKNNVVTLLQHWRRQAKSGVKIGRGRGRPKGS